MRKIMIGVVGLAVMATLCGGARTGDKTELTRSLQVFNALAKELQMNYVDTIDGRDIVRTAIDNMLASLDPYTEYFPQDEQEELLSIASGHYGGIGANILKRTDGSVIIYRPMPGSPSRKAGLRHGDIILAVDGVEVTRDMATDRVSRMLRGQSGTKLSIDVKRLHAQDSLLTFEFSRGEIKVDPMPYYGVQPDGTGYLRLTTFNEQSAGEVKNAVTEMMATPGGLKGLVIDLRENGGGLLESAVQIAGLFVDKGTEIVRTRGRDSRNEKTYKTTSKPIAPDLPLVIITDGNTASASEILAGSLQDLDRAVIVGERSFGKGLVQTSRPLPYDGLLKLTISRYYIPSGRLIQAIDYSHRNSDGSVARIPDSLTRVFHTRAGREVRDGGGITPDVQVVDSMVNRMLYNIYNDMWAYDFATRFAAAHDTIPDADTFEVDDSVFADFKAFLDPARFKYDKTCETGLQLLRKAAEVEGYMTDSVAAQFDILDRMLKHDLNHDLDFNRVEIIKILDAEITDRYYDDHDMAKRAMRGDNQIDTARSILLDTPRYRSILAGPSQKKK